MCAINQSVAVICIRIKDTYRGENTRNQDMVEVLKIVPVIICDYSYYGKHWK